MKKISKRIVMMGALIFTLSFGSNGFAADVSDLDSQSLSVVDGRLSNEDIMEAIESYLYSKVCGDLEIPEVSQSATVESTFESDAVSRIDAFADFETRLEVTFNAVEITPIVVEILSYSDEELIVNVFEMTTIEYYAAEEIETLDIMGYCTEHELTLGLVNGEYLVQADSYDERMITGACSADVALTAITNDLAVEDFILSVEGGETNVASVEATSATYNVNDAIDYANTWCGVSAAKDYAGSGVTEAYATSLYNSAYQYFAGSDCANFVSQCLYAGGLGTDGTWYAYSSAWVNAKALHRYLATKYTTVRATNSNVFPGNPVYWWNGDVSSDSDSPSGHQMICTGYNSSGVPVVNGHSYNMFRVPITNYLNSGNGLYTAQITTSNQHSHVSTGIYQCNESSHYIICKMCRNTGYNYVAHTVVTSGSSQYCSVCGYTGPFALYASIMVKEQLSCFMFLNRMRQLRIIDS